MQYVCKYKLCFDGLANNLKAYNTTNLETCMVKFCVPTGLVVADVVTNII